MTITHRKFVKKTCFEMCVNAGIEPMNAEVRSKSCLADYDQNRFPSRNGVDKLIKDHVNNELKLSKSRNKNKPVKPNQNRINLLAKLPT